MWQNAHDTYLESRVLSADPIELVRMLYQEATRAVKNARSHLAAGDIAARARSISQTSAVVIELATSLDHERGGKISANLAQLYDYMLRRLTEANLQQSDGPLAEVLGLLTTLSEGWDGVKAQGAVAPAARHEDSLQQPAAPKSAVTAAGSWEQSLPEGPATYGSSWSQPAAQESPTTYGSSWSQPAAQESPATYGSSWSQPAAQESPATYGSSWSQPAAQQPEVSYGAQGKAASREPAAAFGNPWAQPAVPEAEASSGSAWGQPVSREPAANSWRPTAHELAAAYGTWAQPASQESAVTSGNPYTEPAAQEPAADYGNSWAHLPPQESSASYSPHDWSL
jgi:flagellar protein FliS